MSQNLSSAAVVIGALRVNLLTLGVLLNTGKTCANTKSQIRQLLGEQSDLGLVPCLNQQTMMD